MKFDRADVPGLSLKGHRLRLLARMQRLIEQQPARADRKAGKVTRKRRMIRGDLQLDVVTVHANRCGCCVAASAAIARSVFLGHFPGSVRRTRSHTSDS